MILDIHLPLTQDVNEVTTIDCQLQGIKVLVYRQTITNIISLITQIKANSIEKLLNEYVSFNDVYYS
jgi:hypothetical protein